MFASLFVLLYVGHLVADYPAQTDHQAAHKADRGAAGWRANIAHAGTHVLVCAAVLAASAALLGELHVTPWRAAVALLWVGATHAAIDRRRSVAWWMRIARQPRFAEHGGAAQVDQTAHVVALAVAALFIAA